MRVTDAEKAELVTSILTPHGNHAFGVCDMGGDLCDECCGDLSISLATAAERERLKALVLAFCERKMYRPWLKKLAALFEVSR